MTQTLQPAPPRPAHANGTDSAVAQQLRRRRQGRAAVAALGLVALAMAVLVFEALVPQAPHSRQVLVAARQIRAGQVIGRSDLAVMTVASSQLNAVLSADRDQVVGRTAGFDVAPGQPLVPADVGGARGPAPGEAVVGLALGGGRLPDGLAAGDAVVVVDTPGSAGGAGLGASQSASSPVSSAASNKGAELGSGRVLSVGRSPDGTRMDVSLVLPATSADAVAEAAAADSVSLLWVSR
jgi:hypothetical protein